MANDADANGTYVNWPITVVGFPPPPSPPQPSASMLDQIRYDVSQATDVEALKQQVEALTELVRAFLAPPAPQPRQDNGT